MPQANRFLSWASGRQSALLVPLVLLVSVVLAFNAVAVYLPSWLPGSIETQIDLTGRANFAALTMAGIGIASAMVAARRAIRSRSAERFVWMAIAIGCLDVALIDLLIDRPDGRLYVPAAVLMAGSFLWILKRQSSTSRRTQAILIIAALLAISNPIVNRYEVALAGDPENYEFVSANEPYRMTPAAWQHLSLVRQGQEASEAILLILVLQLLLFELPRSET